MSKYIITTFYDHVRNAMKQENMSLEEVAAKLKEHGICGVEADYLDVVGEDGEKLAKELSAVGLPVSSVFCHFNWEKDTPTDTDTVLNTLDKLNIRNLLAIPGFILEGQTVEEAKNNFLPKLSNLCDKAEKYNIQILMEDFDYYTAPFGRAEDVKWFLDRIPKLGCAFDTGNFYYFGEDAYEVLPMFLDRIKYVHCKDRSVTPVNGETPTPAVTSVDMYSSPVGCGVIKMREIVDTIVKTGYNGVFAIEHFGSITQFEYMIKSAEFFR